MGTSTERLQDPFAGPFWGHSWDAGHTGFLNSTQKHIKLTLTGYSRL